MPQRATAIISLIGPLHFSNFGVPWPDFCVTWVLLEWGGGCACGSVACGWIVQFDFGQFGPGRSLRDQIFFLLRTALKDRPKGPPTANRQLPPTANRRQLPTAANRQPPPTSNRQPLSTATNHPSPTANCCQPPPTTNRQSPPAANRQWPPTMVEHMSYTRLFLKKPCSGTVFFFR